MNSEKSSRSFELDELLARCMGRVPLVRRVLACFDEQFQQDLEQLAAGVDEGDAPTVAMVAHRLKGAAANVAAPRLQQRAAQVEQFARQGCLDDAARELEHLGRDWRQFATSVADQLESTESLATVTN